MATRKVSPAADVAGDAPPARPDFEVVGDDLVCHRYGDLRLSLVISMAKYQEFIDIDEASTDWATQIAALQDRVMPADVVEAIKREADADFAANFELSKQWGDGITTRLGKALS